MPTTRRRHAFQRRVSQGDRRKPPHAKGHWKGGSQGQKGQASDGTVPSCPPARPRGNRVRVQLKRKEAARLRLRHNDLTLCISAGASLAHTLKDCTMSIPGQRGGEARSPLAGPLMRVIRDARKPQIWQLGLRGR